MNRLVKALLITLAVAVGLVALYFLFEWAGDFLDTGGVVGS
jgi:hypothetical protein